MIWPNLWAALFGVGIAAMIYLVGIFMDWRRECRWEQDINDWRDEDGA